jgi:hypothetical protein
MFGNPFSAGEIARHVKAMSEIAQRTLHAAASWLMGTGRGNDFISNTVLLADSGAEILNKTAFGPIIR